MSSWTRPREKILRLSQLGPAEEVNSQSRSNLEQVSLLYINIYSYILMLNVSIIVFWRFSGSGLI